MRSCWKWQWGRHMEEVTRAAAIGLRRRLTFTWERISVKQLLGFTPTPPTVYMYIYVYINQPYQQSHPQLFYPLLPPFCCVSLVYTLLWCLCLADASHYTTSFTFDIHLTHMANMKRSFISPSGNMRDKALWFMLPGHAILYAWTKGAGLSKWPYNVERDATRGGGTVIAAQSSAEAEEIVFYFTGKMRFSSRSYCAVSVWGVERGGRVEELPLSMEKKKMLNYILGSFYDFAFYLNNGDHFWSWWIFVSVAKPTTHGTHSLKSW